MVTVSRLSMPWTGSASSPISSNRRSLPRSCSFDRSEHVERSIQERIKQLVAFFQSKMGAQKFKEIMNSNGLDKLETPENVLKVCKDGRIFDLIVDSQSMNFSEIEENMSPQKRTMAIHRRFHTFKKAWDAAGLSSRQCFGINDLLQPSKFSATIVLNTLVTFSNKLRPQMQKKRVVNSNMDPFGERQNIKEEDDKASLISSLKKDLFEKEQIIRNIASEQMNLKAKIVNFQVAFKNRKSEIADAPWLTSFDAGCVDLVSTIDKAVIAPEYKSFGVHSLAERISSVDLTASRTENSESEKTEHQTQTEPRKNDQRMKEIYHQLKTMGVELAKFREKAERSNGEAKIMTEEALEFTKQKMRSLVEEMSIMRTQRNEKHQKLEEETKKRKELLNIIHHLKGNIRVLCRIRPFLQGETFSETVSVGDETRLNLSYIHRQKNSSRRTNKAFEFDRVFDQDSDQSSVFTEVEGLVESVLDGYNGCIFAYGQTGSGKTYTMSGGDQVGSEGVNQRAISLLFSLKALREDNFPHIRLSMKVSNVEVYCEKIRDLLGDAEVALELKENQTGVFVEGCVELEADSAASVANAIQVGAKNRAQGNTKMNNASSRSHSVVTISVHGYNSKSHVHFQSKLVLVDLAGSERVGRSGVKGQQMKEAQAINKSLSSLGDVIAAIEAKKSHVPFRNSKLTTMLKPCLGKDNKALMIVQISPLETDAQETNCSLTFASRVKNCELGKARKNISSSGYSKSAPAQAQVEVITVKDESMKKELEHLKSENSKLRKQLVQLKNEKEDRKESKITKPKDDKVLELKENDLKAKEEELEAAHKLIAELQRQKDEYLKKDSFALKKQKFVTPKKPKSKNQVFFTPKNLSYPREELENAETDTTSAQDSYTASVQRLLSPRRIKTPRLSKVKALTKRKTSTPSKDDLDEETDLNTTLNESMMISIENVDYSNVKRSGEAISDITNNSSFPEKGDGKKVNFRTTPQYMYLQKLKEETTDYKKKAARRQSNFMASTLSSRTRASVAVKSQEDNGAPNKSSRNGRRRKPLEESSLRSKRKSYYTFRV